MIRNGLIKPVKLKIFTVIRIFVLTMIFFIWRKCAILTITTAIIVIFTELIIFLIRTIIMITWTTIIINGLIKPVIMKILTIIRIFIITIILFSWKRCNSNNNNSYNCNFYCINNFPDKNNNKITWTTLIICILIIPVIMKIFTVMRIFIITMIIFTWRTGVILIKTTAIIVVFSALIISWKEQ